MELMDISLDKFYKFIYSTLHSSIPEDILGKITVAVSTSTREILRGFDDTMGRDTKKTVFWSSDQVWHKPACATTEDGQKL